VAHGGRQTYLIVRFWLPRKGAGVVGSGIFGEIGINCHSEWLPISFCYYPIRGHSCPNVNHCPRLGSASLGSLVQVANENEGSRWHLSRRLDAECARNSRLYEETVRLQKELDQVKLD